MIEAVDSSTDAVSRSPDSSAAPRPAARSKGAGAKWLILLILILAALGYGWYRFAPGFGPRPDSPLTLAEPTPPLSPAMASNIAALQRSLDDAAGVNRALREQVLGLTQRVGLLEDGLAGMERGAAPGMDAVRLAEADFLLRLGEERLRLFGDVAGARTSFELADEQLSQVSDPRATSVRQTLALERDALAAIAVADVPVILGRLDRLAAQTGVWPLKGRDRPAAADAGGEGSSAWWNRALNSLDHYFRVRRTDPGERAGGGPLLRERLQLDFSRARLLLLRGQGEAARDALAAARSDLQSNFDVSDAGVAQAVAVLGELLAAPLSPSLPTLGESRRELARLRGVNLRPAADQAVPAVDEEAATTSNAPAVAVPGVSPQTPAEAPASTDDANLDPDSEPADVDDADAGTESGSGDDAVPDDADMQDA
ncbi:MAG: uroporphyrinogen-III C-methyltransferase [Lysobacterales bacterium]